MAGKPTIEPEAWIRVGEQRDFEAVVTQVYDEPSANGGDAEVVYFDPKDQVIVEDVRWTGSFWEFAVSSPTGGHADRSRHYDRFVDILKRGPGYH